MPISSATNETPAWIKGDLPNETQDAGAVPQDGSAAEPAAPPDPVAAPDADALRTESQTARGAPAQPFTEPSDAPEPSEAETPSARETFLPALGGAEMASDGAEKPVGAPDDHRSTPVPPEPFPTEPAAPQLPALEALSLEAQIESLLFVADGAVTVGRLAEALEVSSRELESALTALGQSYRQRGLNLQRFRDKAQLTTSPSAAARVERFLGLAAASPLTRAALETLAIVAYQQPVTRPQIEAVRGVNSDSVIKNLLSKGLIEETGRAEGPGRPVLYVTTPEFMQHFGLASLSDLPPLALPGADSAVSPGRIPKG